MIGVEHVFQKNPKRARIKMKKPVTTFPKCQGVPKYLVIPKSLLPIIKCNA